MHYSPHELQEIQDVITGKRKLSPQEIDILKKEFRWKEIPGYLHPFFGLFATNSDLYRKISQDERVKTYSAFGFFPETFGLVYESEVSPQISFAGENRGIVAIISHPTRKVVVKPVQNSREHEVVKIADELEVGPEQYPTLDGFLTEQFVNGNLFTRLKGRPSEDFYQIGRRLGEILSKLHSRDIFYNDVILDDDMGRSHLMVPDNCPAVLFDYGVALRLDRHPNLTDEEVFNYARTLPMVAFSLGTQPTEEQVKRVIQDFRPEVQALTKEQIMSRDVRFVEEGVYLASHRLGNSFAEPFARGFKETYQTI